MHFIGAKGLLSLSLRTGKNEMPVSFALKSMAQDDRG